MKEGTDSSQGVPQIVTNIQACRVVADAVRTTLGPRGMDKLIIYDKGKSTISNDGATILKLLDVVHPAARSLVDIARSQDAEVGDGTTSVALLASEFLTKVKPFIEEGVHTTVIVRAFREGTKIALKRLHEISQKIDKTDAKKQRELLVKCAATALSSKLVAGQKDFFAELVVNAIAGGALEDSMLVSGVAFKKTFCYAGFEMQPKSYQNPIIALLNIELELKAEKENAEIRVTSIDEYQKMVDAEWGVLYEKLEILHQIGAKVILSRLPIGDVVTQWCADRDIFCAGRVQEEDLKRTQMACGGSIQTTVQGLTFNALGTCAEFEEIQIGSERYNIFKGCPQARTCTIILRGGAEQFMEETERSLHDAIMIVRRAMKNDAVVAGGGSIDMEISKTLRQHSLSISGKEQLFIAAMAQAFEVIPRQLCENAGFDSTDILNILRQRHAKGDIWAGVDIINESVADNFEQCVWEPALVKANAITAAADAACLILSVDETVKNPESKNPDDNRPVRPGG